MFTKFIIFLALGCTLTLAHSTQVNKRHELVRQTRGILDKLGSLIHKTTSAVTSAVFYPFDLLIQTGLGIADYGNEKVQQVMQKYYDIKYTYYKNIDEIKNEIIKRAIGEAQNIIDILAREANMTTACNEMQESSKELAESGQEALDKLEQDLENAVNAELKNLEDELANWELEADELSKNVKKPKRSSP